MKKIWYIGLLLLAWGCEKNDVFVYDQPKSSIQFNYKPDKMKLEYNFAFQYKEKKKDPWGQLQPFYLGDSLRRDTVDLYISVLGLKEDIDREFSLKQVLVKGQDSSMVADVEFLPPYYLRAGQLLDTIQVVLLRPDKRGKYTIGVTFDVNDNSPFALGVQEQNVYQLNILDRYTEPADWRGYESFFGEFTEEKYAFYVTVLHKKFEGYMFYMDLDPLMEALDEYNAAHPDAPKDFYFPGW